MEWNDRATALYGYRREEALGETDRPDAVAQEMSFAEVVRALHEGSDMVARRVVRRHKDGSLVHVDVSAFAIHDAAGTVVGTCALHVDVTGEVQAAAALHRSEAYLRSVLDSSAIGIGAAVIDAHGTIAFANALKVVGLINVQYAMKDGVVYVIEVNPRASRTVPFVSKTIGVPLASLAARAMVGESLVSMGYTKEIVAPYFAVKEAVFPFTKFREFDPILGPEMRSTGEVMGISEAFGPAFAKAQLAAGNGLPLKGTVFVTVNDRDKPTLLPIARRFHEMAFKLSATGGTAEYLREHGVPSDVVHKVSVARPNAIDLIKNDAVQLLVNTPLGMRALRDDDTLRQAAIARRVPYTTTLSAASAAADAIASMKAAPLAVKSVQEWQQEIA